MKRPVFNGLDEFSTLEKIFLRVFFVYIILGPAISVLGYDMFIETTSYRHTAPGFWQFVFAFVIVIQIGMVLNNLHVGKSALHVFMLTFRTPIEVAILALLFQWNVWYAISVVYAIEVLGLCIGIFAGVVFRKANITVTHRLLSAGVIALFLMATYFRFEVVLNLFLEVTTDSFWSWVIAAACLVPASLPYIKMFVSGEDGKNLNMGTTPLMHKMTPVLGIAALFYFIGLPLLSALLSEM